MRKNFFMPTNGETGCVMIAKQKKGESPMQYQRKNDPSVKVQHILKEFLNKLQKENKNNA
jgi:hypothetical protein